MGNKQMNHDRWGICLLLTILGVVFAVSAVSAPTWQGSIGEEDGWQLVSNPAEPLESDEVIKPEKLWQIGADEEDMVFGLIQDAMVDEEGNSYLLDSVLSTVYVVDQNGEIINSLGREGDGPGEFRFASEMIFLPDGSVGIMEMMPGKVVALGRDGTPQPSFALTDGGQGMMQHLQHISTNGHVVLIGKVVTNFQEGQVETRYSLTSYNSDGSEKAVIEEETEVQSGGSINIGGGDNDFTSNFTICPDGRVVVFPMEHEYKLAVYDDSGTKKNIIRRDYESVRRSEEALAAARKQAEEMQARFGGQVEMEVEEYSRDISGVISRPNGDIWVANSKGDRDCPDNSIGFFDVFNQDGHFTHRVRIEADYDPDNDNYAVVDDMLYVFKEAQNAPERSSTMGGGGGGMVMMISGGGGSSDDEDDDEEAKPFEVICYKLNI